MTPFYKFLLFLLVFGLVAVAGFVIFRLLNSRLKASRSAWVTIGYLLLMIAAMGILFVAGIYLLVYSYNYLK